MPISFIYGSADNFQLKNGALCRIQKISDARQKIYLRRHFVAGARQDQLKCEKCCIEQNLLSNNGTTVVLGVPDNLLNNNKSIMPPTPSTTRSWSTKKGPENKFYERGQIYCAKNSPESMGLFFRIVTTMTHGYFAPSNANTFPQNFISIFLFIDFL